MKSRRKKDGRGRREERGRARMTIMVVVRLVREG